MTAVAQSYVEYTQKRSFTQRTSGGNFGNRLFLVFANDHTTARAYYYVLAHPLKIPQFQKALAGQNPIDLADYGEIIESGYGDEVPADIKARIEAQYA